MTKNNLSPIFVLIFISLLTKLFVFILPIFVPHTGLDPYDHQYFFDSAQQLMGGTYPHGFSYPILALVPMVVSYTLSFGNFQIFVLIFQLLMECCDIIIIFCIYLIGLKFLTRQQAFIAGLLYALSISVAYFSMTKFDSLPTMLLMLSIYFVIYNKTTTGYLSSIVGMLTKIYPMVALPFLCIYNKQKSDPRIWVLASVGIIVGAIVFKDTIISYLFREATYVNTPSHILGISSVVMYLFATTVLISTMWRYSKHRNDVRALLVAIGVSTFVVAFSMSYHSPQYVVWYLPIFCLLVADSAVATFSLCMVGIAVYLEFPVFYGVLYQNDKFLVPWAPWFFKAEWLLMLLMIYLATRNISKENQSA